MYTILFQQYQQTTQWSSTNSLE